MFCDVWFGFVDEKGVIIIGGNCVWDIEGCFFNFFVYVKFGF